MKGFNRFHTIAIVLAAIGVWVVASHSSFWVAVGIVLIVTANNIDRSAHELQVRAAIKQALKKIEAKLK